MTTSWVKQFSTSAELNLHDFTLASRFVHVANVIRTPTGTRRSTVITFDPVISKKEWAITEQWIYIFTLNGKIVKIGGTRTGLKDRTSSYLCGHHTIQRGKSGKCSVTNAFIYNTFDHYIELGSSIQMWAYKIPRRTTTIDVLGKMVEVEPQVYTAYETGALEEYKKATGHYPILSDNSDPTHRR